MGNHTAQFTVSKILDTFSNNDFVNIYEYNNNVRPLEPCFDDMLVQATKENIAHFKNKMKYLIPEEYANLTLAMERAFQILEKVCNNYNLNKIKWKLWSWNGFAGKGVARVRRREQQL